MRLLLGRIIDQGVTVKRHKLENKGAPAKGLSKCALPTLRHLRSRVKPCNGWP